MPAASASVRAHPCFVDGAAASNGLDRQIERGPPSNGLGHVPHRLKDVDTVTSGKDWRDARSARL
jgi:hypothetical protein